MSKYVILAFSVVLLIVNIILKICLIIKRKKLEKKIRELEDQDILIRHTWNEIGEKPKISNEEAK